MRDKEQMNFVRRKQKERLIWEMFVLHSEEYIHVLSLGIEDLKRLALGIVFPESVDINMFNAGLKGFLRLSISGEEFAIAVKRVYGQPYGGKIEYSALAVCMTSFYINQPLGRDSSLINVVPEDWHGRIFHLLKDRREEYKENQITLLN